MIDKIVSRESVMFAFNLSVSNICVWSYYTFLCEKVV